MSGPIVPYPANVGELVKWLKEQLDEGAVRLVLCAHAERGEQQVHEWPVDAGHDPVALGEVIYRRAHEDGRHFGGQTLYGIFSYREGARSSSSRTFLAIDGEGGDRRYFEQPVERPDAAGVVGQLMRHGEAGMRLAVGQSLDIIAHYKSMLASAQKRIDELEGKFIEMLDLYEELKTMKHQRDLEMRLQDRDDKKQDFLIEKLNLVAPVLMSKVAPGMASKGALGEELLRRFLQSLKPAQMAGIMGHLEPEQAAAINEIYIAYAEREMARDKAKADANGASGKAKGGSKPNGTSNGTTNGASH